MWRDAVMHTSTSVHVCLVSGDNLGVHDFSPGYEPHWFFFFFFIHGIIGNLSRSVQKREVSGRLRMLLHAVQLLRLRGKRS